MVLGEVDVEFYAKERRKLAVAMQTWIAQVGGFMAMKCKFSGTNHNY